MTSGRYLLSSCVPKRITLRDAAVFTQCITERYSSGGPQGDVLGYALRNPHVTHEMDRRAALVGTLRLKTRRGEVTVLVNA